MTPRAWVDQSAQSVRRFWREKNYYENIPFISVGVVSGVLCCLYAMVFAFFEKQSVEFFSAHAAWIFLAAPLLMMASFGIIKRHAPTAFGSGIPQVMLTLEKEEAHLRPSYLGWRMVVGKIISSVVALMGGAAIGREGPSLQVSAAVGFGMSGWFEKLGLKIKTEQLIIAGAAGGLAAAFNTPIGGIVYAVEELTLDHIRSYKTALLLSVLIAGITAQLILGNYLYLGSPRVDLSFGLHHILVVCAVAWLAGVAGALFSKALIAGNRWRGRKSAGAQTAIAGLVGLILAALFYFGGERAVYSGKESINYVLFNSMGLPPLEFIFRFVSPLVSSMTGIAGGIFAPSLSAGAAFGGSIADVIDPGMRTLLGLTGMIGFLTGVTRTPITSFVLVLEMTDRHSAVFPMMMAAAFSALGARMLGEKSFYEETVDRLKEAAAH